MYDMSFPVLKERQSVVVDFAGVKSVLTPFLHGWIGKLFDFFDKSTILSRLQFANTDAAQLKKVNEYIDGTDKRDNDRVQREMMEELFDEDDLGDI